MTEYISAAQEWSSNGHMIADVVRIGHIRPDDLVLDPTYGKGTWWSVYKHDARKFVALDRKMDANFDFRYAHKYHGGAMAGAFDVITFDPPYVSTGGRKTSGIPEFNERYGIGGDSEDDPKTPKALQTLICDGMTSLQKCLKPYGYMFVKCKPYISSGQYFNAPQWTDLHAHLLGMDLIDKLIYVGDVGIQPKGRRQVHARNNYSVLSIYRSRK